MKTCIIYARVSTKDQECENQIIQLRDYAQKQEWKVLEVIADVASGGKGVNERLGLDKVFQLAHKKQFDVLLFWSLSRLSREGSRKTIAYLSELDSCGVDWHSFSESFLSSLGIFSDCIVSLLSALNKQEKIRLSQSTIAGLNRVRQNGKRLGRPKMSSERLSKAMSLREQGLSFSEIGREMGVSRVRAFQMIKEGTTPIPV